MRPTVILLLATIMISAFGFSGYALGKILDEFSPNNIDETHIVDESLDMNSDTEFVNWENSIVEQISVK